MVFVSAYENKAENEPGSFAVNRLIGFWTNGILDFFMF
jgi:hypothetical protein